MIVGGVLVALIAGTTIWRFSFHDNTAKSKPTAVTTTPVTADGSSTPPSATVATTITHVSDSTDQDRTPAGAVHAAIRFLELDEQLFPTASPEKARALTDSITSTGSRRRLGDRAEQHQREILAKG